MDPGDRRNAVDRHELQRLLADCPDLGDRWTLLNVSELRRPLDDRWGPVDVTDRPDGTDLMDAEALGNRAESLGETRLGRMTRRQALDDGPDFQ